MASNVLCTVKILIAILTLIGYKFNYSFAQTFSDVSVMVTNHLTSVETPAVITVYKTANQDVTIYKAVRSGTGLNNQYLDFTGNEIDNEISPNGLSATLKLAGSLKSQAGVYTVTVSQDEHQIEMRILILNSNASVTARDYSTVVSINEPVLLFANEMRGILESSLRWRKDGDFQGEPCYGVRSCGEENAQDSTVFECFVAGAYGDQEHAIMNLIVRGCPDGRWGPDCGETCPRCFNGGMCSDVTGLCQCPPGFSGTNCEQVHGSNVFGQSGEHKCNETGDDNSDGCQGALICYPDPFGCVCPAGYSGLNCKEECEDGTFGANCNQTCHCWENVTCAKDTGVCEDNQCGDGWKGTNCQVESPCEIGIYGDLCNKNCSCQDGNCSEVEENCERGCAIPWTGLACDQGGPGRIDITYVKVNPQVKTNVTCSAVTNPVTKKNKLLLNFSGSDIATKNATSRKDDRGYSRHNTWSLTLSSDEANIAICSIAGQELSSQLTLVAFELPEYTGVNPLRFSEVNSTYIKLTWRAWTEGRDKGEGPIVDYVLRYKGPDPAQWSAIQTGGSLEAEFPNLTPDTEYTFQMRAVRDGKGGAGRFNGLISQKTLCGAPSVKPTLMLTSQPNARTARFSIGIPTEDTWNCKTLEVVLLKRISDGGWMREKSLNTGSTSTDVTDLIPCSSYSFRIRIDTSQGSLWSDIVPFEAAPGALEMVQNLQVATQNVQGQLHVSWGAPDMSQNSCPVNSYTVKYRLVSYLQCSANADVPVGMEKNETTSNLYHVLRNLEASANYEVKVRANGGINGQERTQTGQTVETAPSAAPRNVELRRNESMSSRFGWINPACEHRNGAIIGYFYRLSQINGNQSREGHYGGRLLDISNLTPYTEYSFIVLARTSAGSGPYSEPVVYRTAEDIPPKLLQPVSPFANTSVIEVKWNAPNPPHGVIRSYEISYQRSSKDAQVTSVTVEIAGEPPSYILTGLDASANYTVKVEPTEPVDVWLNCLSSSLDAYSSGISLSLTNRKFSNTGYVALEFILPTLTTFVSNRKLTQVRAYTSVGPGPYSEPLEQITKEGLPEAPVNLNIAGRALNDLTIEWDIPNKPKGKITKYELKYRAIEKPYLEKLPDEDAIKVTIDNPKESNSHKITDLEPSTIYEIQVSAYTSAGQGEPAFINGTTAIFKGLEAVDVNHVSSTRKETTAEVILPALTQKYATGYRIRIKTLQSKRKRVVSAMESYEENPDDYITAELDKEDNEKPFTIGDGKTYGGYFNAPLDKDKEYEMYINTLSKVGGEVEEVSSDPIRLDDGGSNAALIVILILLFIAAILLLAGIIWYKRRDLKQLKDDLLQGKKGREGDVAVMPNKAVEIEMNPSESLDNLANQDFNQTSPKGRHSLNKKSLKKMQKGVKIADLANYVTRKKTSEKDNFVTEYEMLPQGQLYSWDIASKPENKTKNRYGNIIPYDESRVVLPVLEDKPHSDYINASYIDGYQYPNKYIACHGPNKASVLDFWRMVWLENCGKIIMLTNLSEGGKKKCEKYWPDDAMKYGDLKIVCTNTNVYPTCTIRTFALNKIDDEVAVKHVRHFHFTAWPDMKVPDFAGPLLDFLQLIREEEPYQDGPLVVHCSAGVGRTGTYITLDAMLDMAAAEERVNVFQFVGQMRERRIKMVQVVEQYQFIFDALVEYFVIGNTSIQMETFRTDLMELKRINNDTKKSYLQEQYETLQLISVTPLEEKFSAGRKPENRKKNRFQDCLPVDSHRPYLMTDVGSLGNNYINASFLDMVEEMLERHTSEVEESPTGEEEQPSEEGSEIGVQQKNKLLATQMPLENTILDFWRLVWDYNSPAIVMLNDMQDGLVQYWPESGTYQCDPFTITILSCSDQQGIRCRMLEIAHPSQTIESPKEVMHLQVLDWPEHSSAPSSPQTLLQAISMLTQWAVESGDKGATIIHCINGIGRTGIFCGLMNALEQIQLEGKADVFQLINKLRNCRPNMVDTFEQYQSIFDILLSHLEEENIYENYSK